MATLLNFRPKSEQAATPITPIVQAKILVVYNDFQKPWLGLFKKTLLKVVGRNAHLYKIDFATSTGLSKEVLGQVGERYKFVALLCPVAASFVAPPDVSFAAAGGSFYKKKFLVLMDPQHLVKVPHGEFLMERYLAKIFKPEIFMDFPAFKWKRIKTKEEFDEFYELAKSAIFASWDIETHKKYICIGCQGMGLLLPDGRITVGVLDCEDDDFLQRVKLLADTPVAKTMQNGIYDSLYALRWNMPVRNYCHDTAGFMHSWLCELPKDLGFLGGFFLRFFEYWKDDGKNAKSKEEWWTYNAKDCYATLCTAIAQLREAPAYAKRNFEMNFPRTFPCLLMSAHGVLIDEEMRTEIRLEAENKLTALENELQTMTSIPDFNAGSWQQVQKLFKAYGVAIESTEEKELKNVAARHPLYERFVNQILDIRELKKAISTYYKAELLHRGNIGILYYDLIPWGTDTGRLASKKSSFWCGAQIQNQPPYAKFYIRAPDGWELAETDNEQSESRTTAYISGDENLQRTLESGRDFHSSNAVLFFGADYEVAKTKQEDGSDSPMRALAKRINHAVSYNMGASEFVRNAGFRVMEMARKLLNLSPFWSHKEIAEYLIGLFDKAYPKVRNDFQADVKREIGFTKLLVGATGWTRRFFKDPNLTKPALNAAVAHGPQSLSVQIINHGMMKMYALQMSGAPIRMLAQIHDSMFYMVRAGDTETLELAKACMDNPTPVKGKILRIPTATKLAGRYWAKRKKKA